VTLRPEDKQTILSLSAEYGSLAFVTGVWRFVNFKEWYGISNPAGACTVFCREIETSINMNPKPIKIRDFISTYEDQLSDLVADMLPLGAIAVLVMAATAEDDDLINLEAAEHYIRMTTEERAEELARREEELDRWSEKEFREPAVSEANN
jgi:hypothetical protein